MFQTMTGHDLVYRDGTGRVGTGRDGTGTALRYRPVIERFLAVGWLRIELVAVVGIGGTGVC